MFAIEYPNQSALVSSGPFVVESLISTVSSTVPSVFINIMCTAPRAPPESSSPYAPTAKSFTPSLFKSPMFAIDLPKKSELDSVGPFVVEELISTVESTEPSVFINIMCTAPRAPPPSSSRYAPTAKSFTPSLFKSPIFSTANPN